MNTPATRRIDTWINDALTTTFDRIDSYIVRAGDCTEQEVTEALRRGWGEAVADAWREYIEEEA